MDSLVFPAAWQPVLETALDAVVVMDREGQVVDWNHNATAVFGWTAEEVRGRRMADFIIPERFREAHANGLRRFLDTGKNTVLGHRIEIWGLHQSGKEFPIELSISPISDGGSLIFIGFLRDISERRAMEAQREKHADKMEALYRAISFAAENNSLDDTVEVCLACVHKLTGWPLGHVFLPSITNPVRLVSSKFWISERLQDFGKTRAATEASNFASGEGLPGRVWETKEPEWITDVGAHAGFPRAKWPGGIEIKSALAFPILSSQEVVAVVEFFSETTEHPDQELLLTLRAIGQQLGRVYERGRAEQTLREHAKALEAEVAERIEAENHQRFLLAEVNHRVKNMLAVVTSIARQTARHSENIERFTQSFLARLFALNETHSLLTNQSWQAVSLGDLADAVLSPYRSPQLIYIGEPVMLAPKAVLSVGLVLHELITNAAKYGALSNSNGKVELDWECDSGSEPWVKLRWLETGIGPVAPPKRTGFGSGMIQASVRHDLRGKVDISYGMDGIRYDVAFPLKQSV